MNNKMNLTLHAGKYSEYFSRKYYHMNIRTKRVKRRKFM
jgi:hypothetical protein